MIEVSALDHYFGNFHALKNISFSVPSGQITGFIGPNGAGKSTTLRVLSGFLVPMNGEVIIDDIPLFKNPMEARERIGYVPEVPQLHREMQVDEYLNFVANLKGISKKVFNIQLDEITTKCGLSKLKKQLIGNLSKGNRQRVALAQAFIGKPTVLLLDEPMSAMDPVQTMSSRELLKNLSKNTTILISSHILSEISQLCDHLILISDGEIKYQGPVSEIYATSKNGKIVELNFFSMNDDWADKVKKLPECTLISREGSTLQVEIFDEAVFLQNLFELTAKHHIPLREVASKMHKLESFFRGN
ncbi:MAG: ABC transporter ATP-binding protein [Pseudomonadota bacterium]